VLALYVGAQAHFEGVLTHDPSWTVGGQKYRVSRGSSSHRPTTESPDRTHITDDHTSGNMDVDDAMEVEKAAATCESVLDAVGEAVVADRGFLETVLIGVLSRGHVLVEDVPGTGKTLTARSRARSDFRFRGSSSRRTSCPPTSPAHTPTTRARGASSSMPDPCLQTPSSPTR
jgi:hypothetical protein